ncbi:adenosylhomocysteinase [Alloscardovia theropitheci]|uniref:Adenosylhomocysteinase n=1 Tax=Alloscardovia theropitheci TaxID=2496842 RepID=A0A4R0QWT8_9BIFI|nr:adenosylhomocysteinase [Alloscardovia theropitheci]TCD54927.1 adenosylhomocysteinase [Alloscardovia theropitheci]
MNQIEFSSLVRSISQTTNRSLAGARIWVAPDFQSVRPHNFEEAANEWGMRLFFNDSDRSLCAIELHDTFATVDGEKVTYSHDCLCDSLQSLRTEDKSAAEKINLAYDGMPVVRHITDEYVKSGVLQDERIAVSLIIEPKTAVLLLELQRAGAQVAVYATAAEVHQAVADELKERGIGVYADSQWTPSQEHAAALQLLDDMKPTIIIDDGASFARLAQLERPNLVPAIRGVAEETTSGVRAFEAMEASQALPYPVIASNDSQLKTGFDNVHGTGESCATTFLQIMDDNYPLESGTMAVIGFGPVGRGFARRMRSLGARVVIVEQSATAALKAQYEGFEVMPLSQAALECDCLISATGVYHTIDLPVLQKIEDGTVLGVIGGIANEIALDDLTAITHQDISPAVPLTQLDLGNGKSARLIASADGMNYTVSSGNPIEIMDLSFAVQLNAIRMLIENDGELEHRVIRMNKDIDEQIARSALAARGAEIDESQTLVTDWTKTRFSTSSHSSTKSQEENSHA